jgi:hypothetical protein
LCVFFSTKSDEFCSQDFCLTIFFCPSYLQGLKNPSPRSLSVYSFNCLCIYPCFVSFLMGMSSLFLYLLHNA